MKIKCLLLGLISMAALVGCDQNGNNPPPSGTNGMGTNTSTNAMIDTGSGRDQFLATVARERDEMKIKIDDLSTKVSQLEGDAKVQGEKALADLRAQRDAMNQKYDQLKASTGDTWDKTKADFQEGWDKMVAAYDRTRARFITGSETNRVSTTINTNQ